MRVLEVRLRNFRNHEQTEIPCATRANIFLGANGQGKTNIVEAVAYLCLTKSFYAANDRTVVQVGEPGFRVAGVLESDHETSYRVVVEFDRGESGKRFWINDTPVDHLSSVIGRFPVVVVSPEHHAVTFGSPADRRKFLDLVIAQSSRSYMDDLLEYRKALRQRNRILLDERMKGRSSGELVEAWNETLITRGTRLIIRRREFVAELIPLLERVYRSIGAADEQPLVEYRASVGEGGTVGGAVREAFERELAMSRETERRFGSTQVGPHRDELRFAINDLDLRGYASQGQHKTFLTALKIAEFLYLRAQCAESPILILDDVFSELDRARRGRLLDVVQPLGQMFITTTDREVLEEKLLGGGENRCFEVSAGKVAYGVG
jgi:DNA replication and repair protein RecF